MHLQTRDCKYAMKNMNTTIKHSGVVESVTGDCIKVRIVQTSECVSCKVAGHCHASDKKDKTVDVYGTDTSGLNIGDEVMVVASESMGWFAVVLGFVLPFIIVVALLFAVLGVSGNELTAALASLFSLIPYFVLLYLCKDKIRKRISFTIERNV